MSKTDYRFEVHHPRDVDFGDRWSIQNLRQGFYGSAFVDSFPKGAASKEIIAFVGSTGTSSWNNPNKGVGASSRSHPRVVLARNLGKKGEPVEGFVYTANDASSGLPGPLGGLERQAKLHIPEPSLLRSRYLWFRELIAPSDVDEPVLETLVAFATHPTNASPGQPASIYPWEGEDDLMRRIVPLGFWPVPLPEERLIPMYPGSDVKVSQNTFRGNVGVIHDLAVSVDGVSRALAETQL